LLQTAGVDEFISTLFNDAGKDLPKLLMSPPACFLCQVLLFTDKAQSTVLYKALSLAYVGRLRCAEVRPAAHEVVKQYKVDA
jgi:hypothetical protein